MISGLYRKIVPLSARQKIYEVFLGRVVFFFRHFNVITRSKLTYVFAFALPKTEENKAFAFMGRYGLTSYPYPYMLEYKNKKVVVERDELLNLPFVNHRDKPLYFPEFYTTEKVIKDYRALLTEQDERAAHRYVRSYAELKDRVLLDVGAAEGIFSLDTIELTDHVILIECLEHWQKPLQATFAKWASKVTLIKKFVGNKSAGDFVTIDEILSNKKKENLFIKMDIEGAERMALEGASFTLRTGKNIQLSVCTYHRVGDPEYMKNLLSGFGYSTEFSEGLMYWNKRVSKGVIRSKN